MLTKERFQKTLYFFHFSFTNKTLQEMSTRRKSSAYGTGKLKEYTVSDKPPNENDDETAGYAVNSFWLDKTKDVLYRNKDATKGKAVWTPVAAKYMVANVPPNVNDDKTAGYSVNSFWLDKSKGVLYRNEDASAGNAVWKPLSFGRSTTSRDEEMRRHETKLKLLGLWSSDRAKANFVARHPEIFPKQDLQPVAEQLRECLRLTGKLLDDDEKEAIQAMLAQLRRWSQREPVAMETELRRFSVRPFRLWRKALLRACRQQKVSAQICNSRCADIEQMAIEVDDWVSKAREALRVPQPADVLNDDVKVPAVFRDIVKEMEQCYQRAFLPFLRTLDLESSRVVQKTMPRLFALFALKKKKNTIARSKLEALELDLFQAKVFAERLFENACDRNANVCKAGTCKRFLKQLERLYEWIESKADEVPVSER